MTTFKSVRRTLRALLCLAFVCLLVACGGGGGGSEPPRALQLWGDSMSSGDWYGPNGEPHRLERPSAVQLQALLPGWTITDRSYGGLTPSEALGVDARPGAPLFVPGADALMVLRFGPAAWSEGQGLLTFEQYLDKFVADAGARVLLVGTETRSAPYDAVVRKVAITRGVPYVDISAVPLVLLDEIHADQATSDAVSALIADAILKGEHAR